MVNVEELLEQNDELMHYGTPRHSGRYPWGSGDRPFQGTLGKMESITNKAYEKSVDLNDKVSTKIDDTLEPVKDSKIGKILEKNKEIRDKTTSKRMSRYWNSDAAATAYARADRKIKALEKNRGKKISQDERYEVVLDEFRKAKRTRALLAAALVSVTASPALLLSDSDQNELYHGGPGSGRFPLGSGDRPYQHRANGRVTAALKKATSKETRDKVKAATKSYMAKQKAKKEHKELVDAQKQVYKAEVDKIKAETELAKQRAKSEANARKVQAALEVLSAAYSVANHVNNISKNNEKIESVTKKNKEAEEQAKKYADIIAELRERDKYDADKASLEDAKTRAMNEAVWLNNQQKIDRNLKPQTEKVPDSNTVAEAINILSDVVKITKNGKAVFKG